MGMYIVQQQNGVSAAYQIISSHIQKSLEQLLETPFKASFQFKLYFKEVS